MANYTLEFKATSSDGSGTETRHVKRVVDQGALATFITTFATTDGIEFFTVRRLPEVKPKAVVPVKAVTK